MVIVELEITSTDVIVDVICELVVDGVLGIENWVGIGELPFCVDWLEEPSDEVALLETVDVVVDEEVLRGLEDELELVGVIEVTVGGEAGEAVPDDEPIVLLIEESVVLLKEEVVVLFITNATELRNTPL
jgi:hypothetical protein